MSQAQRLEVEARIRSVLSKAEAGIPGLRQAYDSLCDFAPLPDETRVEKQVIGGVEVEVLHSVTEPVGTIIYLHGGGHMVGSVTSHRGLAARLGVASSTRVVLVDFRLAPEHVYPAALDDVLAVYRALLDEGIAPSSLSLAGDSAGGGLCLALMLRARDEGLPLPVAASLFSPFVDLTGQSPSIQDNGALDVMVTPDSVSGIGVVWVPGGDLEHPYVSPIFGDLQGLPPLLIHVGGRESLLDDSLRLARRAGMASVPVQLEIWPDMPHVWQIFAPSLDEAAASLEQAGRFLRDHLHRA